MKIIFISLICLVLFCASAFPASLQPHAGIRLIGMDNSTMGVFVSYWMSEEAKTWDKASAHCKQMYGSLVSPWSPEIDLKLREKMEGAIADEELDPKTPVWTDGCFNTCRTPPSWVWTTTKNIYKKADLDPSRWGTNPDAPGQPNRTHCMAAHGTGRAYKWYQHRKTDKLFYVCVMQD